MKKFLLICALLITGICSVSSQQFTSIVCGEVLDQDEMPLSGATVILRAPNGNIIGVCVTELDGFFSIISHVFSMDAYLTVSFIGYKTEYIQCPTYNGTTFVSVQLEEDI